MSRDAYVLSTLARGFRRDRKIPSLRVALLQTSYVDMTYPFWRLGRLGSSGFIHLLLQDESESEMAIPLQLEIYRSCEGKSDETCLPNIHVRHDIEVMVHEEDDGKNAVVG